MGIKYHLLDRAVRPPQEVTRVRSSDASNILLKQGKREEDGKEIIRQTAEQEQTK